MKGVCSHVKLLKKTREVARQKDNSVAVLVVSAATSSEARLGASRRGGGIAMSNELLCVLVTEDDVDVKLVAGVLKLVMTESSVIVSICECKDAAAMYTEPGRGGSVLMSFGGCRTG